MGNDFIYLNSIETYCEYCGFEIKHPLVAVVNMAEAKRNYPECKLNYGFYALWLKQGVACSLRYGRRKYDYQEGTVVSFAPGQVVKVEPEQGLVNSSIGLLFHPDLIHGTSLGKKIADYTFFSYDEAEALHLSEDEKKAWLEAVGCIKDADEYLKKFFNFELLFPIDDSFLKNLLRERVVNTLTKYYGVRFSMPSIEKDFLSTHYVQYVFQSPRDVYRYINLLTYTLDLFKMYGILEEVNVTDLLRLQLIQFISPTVYKVLRDEMDLLLNVRGYDGRVHLKEGYKDIIISRQSKKQIEEVLSHVKLRNGDKQEEPEDAAEEELTLFGIPAEERPNKEDIVSELLRELFYDTQNYQEKNRICYLGEYFKFFAGKYSKGELSYQYMQDLMNESNEETFEKTMNQAVLQGKSEFLIHKLKQYVEDTRIEKDIPTVLKRCITIEETVYRDWSQSRDFPASPKDYKEIGQFRPVYSNLFLVDQKCVEVDKEKIERLRAIYAENKKYAWLAESLKLPIAEEYGRVFIYGPETLLELKECIIRRFITEELADHPFEREKIEAIPMLRELYRAYWDEQFKEYVNNSSEPMAWLYMLLKPSGDLLQWNYMAYKNLVGEGVLAYYAKDSLGLELSPEVSNDLAKIGVNHTGVLSATNFGHHPFLVEAKKWWDEKVKNE